MSTDLTAITAAELVQKAFDIDTYLDSILCRDEETYSELCLIRAELDRRCTKAGIMIDPEGCPVFFNFDHCQHFLAPKPELYASAEFFPPPKPVARVNVKAEDVRVLLGYLIAKGGDK